MGGLYLFVHLLRLKNFLIFAKEIMAQILQIAIVKAFINLGYINIEMRIFAIQHLA